MNYSNKSMVYLYLRTLSKAICLKSFKSDTGYVLGAFMGGFFSLDEDLFNDLEPGLWLILGSLRSWPKLLKTCVWFVLSPTDCKNSILAFRASIYFWY